MMLKTVFKISTVLCCCLPLSAGAQINTIAEKLKEYCSNVAREEIFVHTDRDNYIAGEDMWFKVYALERQSLEPSSGIIAYFELLSYENRPVIRKRIRLKNGSGPGQISLPDTLSSGVYTIRAYTSWMKNFMPANCFVKEIRIYNAIGSGEMKKPVRHDQLSSNTPGKGWLMDVENRPDSLIIVARQGQSSDISGRFFLLIHTRGNVNHTDDLNINGSYTRVAIPKMLLDPGINHITMFNGSGAAVAERFVYTPPASENMRSISASETTGMREKITTQIDGLRGDFSMSVSPRSGNSIDISDYMIFGSEFGTDIQRIVTGMDPDLLTGSFIDSLLSEAESNWIVWEEVLSGRAREYRYSQEVNDHFLTGSIVNGDPAGKFVIMSIPGKEASFQYSITDKDGNFSFSIPVDGELRDIIIQPDELGGKSVVKMGSSFMEEYPVSGSEPDTSQIPSFISEWSTNYQVGRIYGIKFYAPAPIQPVTLQKNRRFYGKPDIELKLADYIKLPVMEEIFFEIIPGANLRKRRTGYEITIADPVTNTIYDVPPSLFVDGVRIDNADIIAGIDPELVERIDVVLERYLIGDYLFNGIINVITKKADLSAIELPQYALRTRYRVFDPSSVFVAPAYLSQDLKQGRIPDFRNTLYWNPSVSGQDNAFLEFWSSDIPGEYEVKIEGISSDGQLISARKIIRVE